MGLTNFARITGNPGYVKKFFSDATHLHVTPVNVCRCLEVTRRILGDIFGTNKLRNVKYCYLCYFCIYQQKL